MEKEKLTIPYIIHNWKSLSMSKKRSILTVLLFGAAALLIVVALIIGIASCSCSKKENRAVEVIEPIPGLLRAPVSEPQETVEADPDPSGEDQNLPEITETPDPEGEDPEATPEVPDIQTGTESAYGTLKKHDQGESVTKLQSRLMELGYLEIEEPTDYYGNSTAYAVQLFQRQHGLTQDGVAGEQTQSLLYSKDAQHYMLLEGSEGRDVKMLQEQLVDLGYLDESEIDHIYGEKTVEAVKAFQKRNGLTQDGKAGEKTLAKLFGEDAKISKSLEAKLKEEEKAEKATPKPTKSPSKTTPKTTSKPKNSSKATAKPTAKPTPTPKKDSKIDKLISTANSKIGCEYVLGGRGPKTFDCSGLVYYCLRQAGVNITRMNAAGYSRYSRWKNITSISSLKRGDILFFRSDASSTVSHCGIYIGSNYMIDASSSNGKVVKRPLSNYWKTNFVNARRPWE